MKERPLLVSIGTELGQFHLLKLLGQGHEGDVFLARDELSGQSRTIKVLRGRDMESNVRRATAYYAALSDSHAVKKCFGYGVLPSQRGVGDRCYMVFEFLQGETIHEHIQSQIPPDPVKLVRLVCRSLAQVHARQRCIGDFDCGRNILLSPFGRTAKFLDLDWTSRWSHRALLVDLNEVIRLFSRLSIATEMRIEPSFRKVLRQASSAQELLTLLR